MKCEICGSVHKELPECTTCGKKVCDNEVCSEFFEDTSDTLCRECLDKMEKCDCNKCRYQDTDECPMEGYSYVYGCPEYDDSKILGYDLTFSGFHELDGDETDCHWPGCNHQFHEGELATIERENGREGIYCVLHGYTTPFSEEVEIIGKTRQELNEEEEQS